MLLDPKTVPIGSTGYVPPLSCEDFKSENDFAWFLNGPDVVLSEDRKWRSLDGHNREVSPDAVYDDWREAVRHTVDEEHASGVAMFDEAIALLRQSNRVSHWLAAHK